MEPIENLTQFGFGVSAAIVVGAVMTAIKNRAQQTQRRLARQLEIAEMVGAVRAEIAGTNRDVVAIREKLEGLDDKVHEMRLEVHDLRDEVNEHLAAAKRDAAMAV